jgi:hypothetical protein
MPTERAEQSGPMMDWERKWAECHDTITANDSAVEISVVDPEVHGTNMVTKYVAYTVKTEPYMYSVCRRYSGINRFIGLQWLHAAPATTVHVKD